MAELFDSLAARTRFTHSCTAVKGDIFDGSFRDNFRPGLASDVISGANVEQVGVGVNVKFGDYS